MSLINELKLVDSLLRLLAWQSTIPLVVVPSKIRPPNSVICAPNSLPEMFVPSDFATCFEDVAAARGKQHPEMNKRTAEIITMRGYPLTTYNVTTADGYILALYRIPGSPNSPPSAGKPAVLIIHGLLSSSSTWLLLEGNRALPMKLADAGYDVWLGNSRGTSYSLGHTKYNSAVDMKYWDFSWHELGIYDVPAFTEKVLNVTGEEKIMYVGHSMGTTQYFVSLSILPEMNDKIQAAVLLAPVAYMGHGNNAIRFLAPVVVTQAQDVVGPLIFERIDEFQRFQAATNRSAGDLCTPSAIRCGLCDNILYFIAGDDAPQNNYVITTPPNDDHIILSFIIQTNLPNILSKVPDNASFKCLVHYAQSMNTCSFRQYDYGILGNIRKYREPVPPLYNITKITAPTYLVYGDRDNFAPPIDVEITKSHMEQNTVDAIRVEWNLFNHFDFVFPKDADTLVYDKVLKILNGNRAALTA